MELRKGSGLLLCIPGRPCSYINFKTLRLYATNVKSQRPRWKQRVAQMLSVTFPAYGR